MLTPGLQRRVLRAPRQLEGLPIANSTVLIIVAVLVTLGLVGMAAGVRYTCRGDDRPQRGQSPDETAAKDQAAQIDSDIEAFRKRGRLKNSIARASETAHLREQLSDRDDRSA